MKSKLVRFIDLQFTIERVGLIDTDQNPPPPRPVACRPAADRLELEATELLRKNRAGIERRGVYTLASLLNYDIIIGTPLD